MTSVEDSSTRITLLRRLRDAPDDPGAWAEFVHHYGPRILRWATRWGLQSADAEDVVQAVLLKLAVRLREFQYSPEKSFRAWLKTVAHHTWRDYADREDRPDRGGNAAAESLLETVEARRSLLECLEEAFDLELFRAASARVRLRVEPRTWEAFRLLAVERWSGVEAAVHLGMKPAAVFVARSKVQRMLREEIARLDEAD